MSGADLWSVFQAFLVCTGLNGICNGGLRVTSCRRWFIKVRESITMSFYVTLSIDVSERRKIVSVVYNMEYGGR